MRTRHHRVFPSADRLHELYTAELNTPGGIFCQLSGSFTLRGWLRYSPRRDLFKSLRHAKVVIVVPVVRGVLQVDMLGLDFALQLPVVRKIGLAFAFASGLGIWDMAERVQHDLGSRRVSRVKRCGRAVLGAQRESRGRSSQ